MLICLSSVSFPSIAPDEAASLGNGSYLATYFVLSSSVSSVHHFITLVHDGNVGRRRSWLLEGCLNFTIQTVREVFKKKETVGRLPEHYLLELYLTEISAVKKMFCKF